MGLGSIRPDGPRGRPPLWPPTRSPRPPMTWSWWCRATSITTRNCTRRC